MKWNGFFSLALVSRIGIDPNTVYIHQDFFCRDMINQHGVEYSVYVEGRLVLAYPAPNPPGEQVELFH